MFRAFARLLSLTLLTGSFCLGLSGCSHEKDKDEEHKEEHATSQPVSRNPQGETVVTLDEERQKQAGIVVQPVVASTLQPELVAYGRLEEDPNRSFTLRAPVAGILRGSDASSWPQLGQTLKDGVSIGHLEPRLGPVEQIDLASRLSTARGEVEEISADLAAAVASYENKKKLNTQQEIVSQRTLEEAKAKVRGQEARLKAAHETVHVIENSLTASSRPAGSSILTLAAGGEVVELTARPGESVEAGQAIMRVARYDRLIARLELPIGDTLGAPPASARIIVAGHDHEPLNATAAAIAPTVNPLTGGQAFLFILTLSNLTLRPGLAITGYLAAPGEPQKGVIAPHSAVVRLGGKSWVYLQTDKEQFTRREVEGPRPAEGGWFVSAGLDAGQNIVVTGAQSILSEEFTSHAGAEEEE